MTTPHGTKRPADSAADGDGEQRLRKRFDRLALDAHASSANIHASSADSSAAYTPVPAAATTPPPAPHVPPKRPRPRPRPADSMAVDDTPHRVYIHDLAAELSDSDSDADRPVFLSDIEKHLSRIPRHVLLGPPPAPTAHNQVVLYNVPASLSVPHERDGVRKAIVEARQRIRDRQVSGVTELGRAGVSGVDNTSAGVDNTSAGPADEDAMDLD
ncbi:hypothetical protein C7974DRAFT_423203 [Boeremia exigua]|uniref:uncharacterized protein n=1 Tax=Boeremia exigua TaxID=749465 RepID=UPI001E8DB6B6|nr:uncharacterized protein C7974DRAFT_423203 [Boeremia exigua]KAH6638308.1 hypothetical protein C7974DRAFT_423203 [Boeremia exigua]